MHVLTSLGAIKRRDFIFSTGTLALLTGCGVLPKLGKPASPEVARVAELKFADGRPVADPTPRLVDLQWRTGVWPIQPQHEPQRCQAGATTHRL